MHPVSVSWVLGHAKRIDVLRGRTTWADKLGNDGADELAVAGAATHAITADIIESAQSRMHVAMSVHTMMLDITRARQSARPAECDRDADRGSDLGDVSESDVCDSDAWVCVLHLIPKSCIHLHACANSPLMMD